MANDDKKRNYVPIEVESLLRWAESEEDDRNKRPSICKVPSILRDLSPDSFRPQLVSIGPLHKEEPNVQYIEMLKRSYLHDLLKRPTSPPWQPKTKLEDCLQKVNASIAKIKSSYSATEYSEDQLANMMVMDGCFILEFCLKEIFQEQTLLSKIQTFRISIDLMLLENQIPFFVLQDIFDLTKPDSISLSLTSLLHKVLLDAVHPFYNSPNTEIPDEFSSPNVLNNLNHVHVLDCLHKIYKFKSSGIVNASCGMCNVPWLTLLRYMCNMCNMCGLGSCLSKKLKTEDAPTALNYNHTAVELERSGVNFKPQKEKNKAMAMKFVKASSCVWWPWKKPITLVMPTLIIQDATEVVLRNFIAYEQFNPQVNYYFTSYSCIMDKLIDNEADVGTLVESRVLMNLLGSYKDAATMINSICKNMQVEQFYYSKETQALDKYYNSFWPHSFAHLRRTYFNSPWSFIALLAGFILFGLTVVQTIFTVMSNYK